MRTILQTNSAFVWTGVSARLPDGVGIPGGWVEVPSVPAVPPGGYLQLAGAGRFGVKFGTAPAPSPPDFRMADPSLFDYGGAADYAGSPLYDGADSGRVSATDNTAAIQQLINNAIRDKTDVVIPAGHFGIKAGGIVASGFDSLTIRGAGEGVSILDFIAEDTSGSSYVNPASARSILDISNGRKLAIKNLTIKGTTKGGVAAGDYSPANKAPVYFGKIWGCKISNVSQVVFENVGAERFNYCGFRISGCDVVVLDGCKGFWNSGSGYWVQNTKELFIIGGEYAYNGSFGLVGTGYGVTGSSGIGEMVAFGVVAHNNFQTGIDSHGCEKLIVDSCIFTDNLIHVGNTNTNVGAASSVAITNNVFANGATQSAREWIKAHIDACVANGFGVEGALISARVVGVSDSNSNVKNVVFSGNTIACHYNSVAESVVSAAGPIFSVNAKNADVKIVNNFMDFNGATFSATGNVESHWCFQVRGKTVTIGRNDIALPVATSYINSTTLSEDRGVLFGISGADAPENGVKLNFYRNNISVSDVYLFANSSGGSTSPIVADKNKGACISVENNSLQWSSLPWPMTSSVLAEPLFFGGNGDAVRQFGNALTSGSSTAMLSASVPTI